jgi:hypothetical protein
LPPVEPDDDTRLGGPTLAFGFLCVVSGIALAGSSRPSVALIAGGAGTVAIAARRGVRRAEHRHIQARRATGTESRQGRP